MNLLLNEKRAAKALVTVNIVLLFGAATFVLFVLLEDSPEMSARLYQGTHPFQPVFIKL